MKKNKTLSGILLISCTSIGAGMLALPCATVKNGFLIANLIFILCWIFMTLSSFFILEITFWFKKKTNLLSIVNQILGYKWKLFTSILYTSLLYSLLSAYIFAYNKWLNYTFQNFNFINLINIFIFLFIIIFIIIDKNNAIKKLNYFLSISLFIIFILIVVNCIPFIKTQSLKIINLKKIDYILPLIITSFGSGIIIPTLTNFLKKNTSQLKKTIFIGNSIPLIIYSIWLLTILGIFPTNSKLSLSNLNITNQNFDITFMYFINQIISSNKIFLLIIIFSITSILTSIIGVTLSLNDILSDEFNIKKNYTLIFIFISFPSIFFSMYYTEYFTNILKFSGILVSILLGILPITMIWVGRYKLKIKSTLKIPGEKILLIISYIFFSIIMCSFFRI